MTHRPPTIATPPTSPDAQSESEDVERAADENGPGSSGTAPTSDSLELEHADRARSLAGLERDVHALSHSIRSPLVAVKGFAGLLEEELGEQLDDSGRHFLGRIQEAGRRMEWQLNDLNQLLALYEQAPSANWCDPVPVIESLASEFKPALDEAGMRILVSLDVPLVYCDRAQLALALRHLIGNALQHGAPSEPRHVEVHVARSESDTRVTVTDSGPGMDEALARRAFEAFDRSGERHRCFDGGRESSGVGLGLVRRIAEAHGGDAAIESDPGRGTRVVMTFPHG